MARASSAAIRLGHEDTKNTKHIMYKTILRVLRDFVATVRSLLIFQRLDERPADRDLALPVPRRRFRAHRRQPSDQATKTRRTRSTSCTRRSFVCFVTSWRPFVRYSYSSASTSDPRTADS